MKLKETLKQIKRIRREITDERDISAIVIADKNGVIESWHYKNAFGLAEQTIDIAMFDEQHLADAIHFAKTGERPETCLEYKTGKTAKGE